MNNYRRILPIFFLIDLLITILSVYLIKDLHQSIFLFIPALQIILSLVFKTYHEYRGEPLHTNLLNLIISQTGILLGLALYIVFSQNYETRVPLLYFFILDTVLLLTAHIIRHYMMNRVWNQKGDMKVITLGNDLDIVNVEPVNAPDVIEERLKNTNYDLLLITEPYKYEQQLNSVIDIAKRYGVEVRISVNK